MTAILVDALIGTGIFLLVAPFIFAVIAVAVSILQGMTMLTGSLLVSAKRRSWQLWCPGWCETTFLDGF